ncbi:MAG TPA: hypothetical protein VNU68_35295 [Verrucomicrobiae bacterium]|nr:hypothetical protein [Verrucomicrobiae bacterium]
MALKHLAPFAFLPFCVALSCVLFVQWERADGAEYRAREWERVAKQQGGALDELMKADEKLKAATNRLQIACAARQP